jgi:hypothetical protein
MTEHGLRAIQQNEPRNNLQAALADALSRQAAEHYAPPEPPPVAAAPPPIAPAKPLSWTQVQARKESVRLEADIRQVFQRRSDPYLFLDDLVKELQIGGQWAALTAKGLGRRISVIGWITRQRAHPMGLGLRFALERTELDRPTRQRTTTPVAAPVAEAQEATPLPTPEITPATPAPAMAFEPRAAVNEMLADPHVWGLVQSVLRYQAAVTPSAQLRDQYALLAEQSPQDWPAERVQLVRFALGNLPFGQIQSLLNMSLKRL